MEDVEGIVQFKETKVTINHATLGELQATLVGTEVSNKIDLDITVYASTLKKNIKVLFTGDKINSEPKDFAGEIASVSYTHLEEVSIFPVYIFDIY